MTLLKHQHITNISDIPETFWQNPDSPFTSKAYWQALEDNQLIGEGTDWDSRYIVLLDNDRPIAMMPVFIKEHHQGEYVFDHAWAHAFHRYGINYYPRLVTSVPFTPVVGQRIWLAEGVSLTNEIFQAFDSAINDLAIELKAPTWHGLFMQPEQAEQWQTECNLLERHGCQFLWHNQNFESKPFIDFDGFLTKLKAKKRKNIRAERRKVAEEGISCQWKLGITQNELEQNIDLASAPLSQHPDITISPEPITQDDWKAFYHCYAMTYAVRGQQPYLSLAFFTQLAQTMPEYLALAQAVDEQGDIVACSLFFYDLRSETSTLYGRYWGALSDVNFLHFELCYYQGISFAIAMGLQHFDPGTQGEHKLIRGFEPVISHSLHKVFVPEFIPAIREYCELEQKDIAQYAKAAEEALPFKQME